MQKKNGFKIKQKRKVHHIFLYNLQQINIYIVGYLPKYKPFSMCSTAGREEGKEADYREEKVYWLRTNLLLKKILSK